MDGFPNRFFWGIAENFLRSIVPVGNDAFQCLAYDRVIRGFNNLTISQEAFFRNLTLGDILPDTCEPDNFISIEERVDKKTYPSLPPGFPMITEFDIGFFALQKKLSRKMFVDSRPVFGGNES